MLELILHAGVCSYVKYLSLISVYYIFDAMMLPKAQLLYGYYFQ